MGYRLELRGVSKHYAGVVANQDISLGVEAGEIHAILGENGAGKSTLMKIIYGAIQADAGEMLWEGERVKSSNPASARRRGIGMVYQHFSLFETVSVVENIAVTMPGRFNLTLLAERIQALAERYQMPVEPHRLLHHLSVGERQRVEILRCLLQSPRLLILDEPTSVLTPQAARQLFAVLRTLAAEGCSILYISHKLEEIRELCDCATILRAGRVVGAAQPRESSTAELAALMVGSAIPAVTRRPAQLPAQPRLEIRHLTTRPSDPFGVALRDISLAVQGGEVVGIAGVAGNGQEELLRALTAEPATEPDVVRLDGAPVAHLGMAARRAAGLGYVPEERLGHGAVPEMSLADNGLLTGDRSALVRRGLIRGLRCREFAQHVIERFQVKCTGTAATAGSLSGGNLQKFIVGRELSLEPKLLIVAQPTWGVDVAAAAFLRQSLIDLSRRGAAVLVVSEELEELFEICDRIAVLYRGLLSPAMAREATSPEEVGLLMAGGIAACETAA